MEITTRLLDELAAELRSHLGEVVEDARRILASEGINYTEGTTNGLFHDARVVGFDIEGEVGSTGRGAVFAHEGRGKNKPWPPAAPIREWLRTKKGVPEGPELDRATFLVRRKIGRKGIKGTRFLARPLEAREPDLLPRLARAADRALDGIHVL